MASQGAGARREFARMRWLNSLADVEASDLYRLMLEVVGTLTRHHYIFSDEESSLDGLIERTRKFKAVNSGRNGQFYLDLIECHIGKSPPTKRSYKRSHPKWNVKASNVAAKLCLIVKREKYDALMTLGAKSHSVELSYPSVVYNARSPRREEDRIPESDGVLSHLCDRRGCIRMQHLETASYASNNERQRCRGITLHIFKNTIIKECPCTHSRGGTLDEKLRTSCMKLNLATVSDTEFRTMAKLVNNASTWREPDVAPTDQSETLRARKRSFPFKKPTVREKKRCKCRNRDPAKASDPTSLNESHLLATLESHAQPSETNVTLQSRRRTARSSNEHLSNSKFKVAHLESTQGRVERDNLESLGISISEAEQEPHPVSDSEHRALTRKLVRKGSHGKDMCPSPAVSCTGAISAVRNDTRQNADINEEYGRFQRVNVDSQKEKNLFSRLPTPTCSQESQDANANAGSTFSPSPLTHPTRSTRACNRRQCAKTGPQRETCSQTQLLTPPSSQETTKEHHYAITKVRATLSPTRPMCHSAPSQMNEAPGSYRPPEPPLRAWLKWRWQCGPFDGKDARSRRKREEWLAGASERKARRRARDRMLEERRRNKLSGTMRTTSCPKCHLFCRCALMGW